MPLNVSVVVPTYRRPHLLRRCLEALAAQTMPQQAYEVLVVSDGYDAQSERVVTAIRETFSNAHYLYLPKKGGPAAARNKGWKQAAAPLVVFTDDDTIPSPGWLQAYWNSYANERLIAFTGPVQVPLPAAPTDYERNTAGLETAEIITANCGATLWALEKVGGFDERFSMAWRGDSDLHFKLLQHGIPIRKVNAALVVHPVRLARWGISIREQKKGVFNALLYKKFPHLYRAKIQPAPAWAYYLIVICFACLVVALVYKLQWLRIVALLCWTVLFIRFVAKRLAHTNHSPAHVLEMAATSLLIPFASVYWQLYGAFKYRVFFL